VSLRAGRPRGLFRVLRQHADADALFFIAFKPVVFTDPNLLVHDYWFRCPAPGRDHDGPWSWAKSCWFRNQNQDVIEPLSRARSSSIL